ncbi:MAG: EAL domain-containing protein [Paraclostridium sp.]|uniref:EAL domain-containing protein n=1 Tax=Paraclostridium sp. TaxID=2023273 RepID=UPI003F40CCD5
MINQFKKILSILIIVTIFIVFVGTGYAQNKENDSDEILNVGFYDYSPYYYLENGKPSGYYNDILNIICEDLGIKYKYVKVGISEAVNMLEKGKIDLVLGINRTPDRMEKFLYTNNYIAIETYGIYTNKNIQYGDLHELENLKFAYIQGEANSDWITDLLKKNGINIIPVSVNSYKELNKLLANGDVDASISNINSKDIYNAKKIFEYSAGPVYIATNKEYSQLIKNIDDQLEVYEKSKNNSINKLEKIYFEKNLTVSENSIISIAILIIGIIVAMAFFIYKSKLPEMNKKKIQNSIRDKIEKQKYFLQYQPIVNPKDPVIIGFEGLLRLEQNGNVLTPNYFIKDIEDNNMLFEISLYILKNAINDYKIISKHENINNNNLYISINMSLKEIENDKFIRCICDIAKNLKMKEKSICIEIVESVRINDLSKITCAIKKLKKSGFIIAIDDFGVEYSNIDILEKLDFDIVKLDKYFIDDINNSIIIKEAVKFLSNICKAMNKAIISEGVEHKYQRDIIKNMDNNKFYIQGYFYSKPLNIEDISKLYID